MLTLRVHDYQTRKGGQSAVLTHLRPYVRLRVRLEEDVDEPPIFIQGGHYYTEDGKEIAKDKLPKWVEGEVAKLSAGCKKDIGLTK